MTKKMVDSKAYEYIDITPENSITLGELLEQVNGLIAKHGKDSFIEEDNGYDELTIIITSKRLETDDEYQDRLLKEKEARTKRILKNCQQIGKLTKETEKLLHGDL